MVGLRKRRESCFKFRTISFLPLCSSMGRTQCPQRYVACPLSAPLPVSISSGGRFFKVGPLTNSVISSCSETASNKAIQEPLPWLYWFPGFCLSSAVSTKIKNAFTVVSMLWNIRISTATYFWTLCLVCKLQERDILKFFLLVEIRNKSCTNAAVRNICLFVDLKNCEHFWRV